MAIVQVGVVLGDLETPRRGKVLLDARTDMVLPTAGAVLVTVIPRAMTALADCAGHPVTVDPMAGRTARADNT